MPYQISWYVEPYILLLKFTGEVTIEEFADISKQSIDHISQQPHSVYRLVDLTEVSKVPTNLRLLRAAAASNSSAGGKSLIYGHNPLVGVIVNALVRLLQVNVQLVGSQEAALNWIRKNDPEIASMAHHNESSGDTSPVQR